MSWLALIFEIGLPIIGYFVGWSKSEAETAKWLRNAADILNKKGWIRDKFVLQLESDRRARLKDRMEQLERETEE